ncbi:glycine zipper 2TM domain-containing protein [Rhodospirillum centenum]|uniref:17 kDa surface antigen n=1 Tax=Rhodospirillum centenum (strain ATCC 51521 / SW) TaxID=414684 RepID=B6IXE1_RHOCS|nr:glycine zipper 2TM domain-containing protein [Rhodospirillum centenum]ACJ00965.1 rickettsia 17 kDa surface antigen, putative [Rhodospirillum centenum SW]
MTARFRPTVLAALLLGSLSAAPALADPPPWAPAHGHHDRGPGHPPRHWHPDDHHDGRHRDRDRGDWRHDDHGHHDHRRHDYWRYDPWRHDHRGRWDQDDRRHGGWKHDHRRRDGRVVVHPYPVAPVYGRFYALPVGVERGRCDRGLVDASLGTLLGAVGGGLAGSQIGDGDGQVAATIGGVLLGAVLGGALDAPADRGCFVQAMEHAPGGSAITWHNPDAGIGYEIVPEEGYERTSGRYCREYTSRAFIGSRLEEVTGTACRQPDGTWEIIN